MPRCVAMILPRWAVDKQDAGTYYRKTKNTATKQQPTMQPTMQTKSNLNQTVDSRNSDTLAGLSSRCQKTGRV